MSILCPDCRDLNKGRVQLNNSSTGMQCGNGHKFMDTAELMSRNPEMVKVPPRITIQEGQTSMQLTLPSKLRDAVAAKYGDKLNATIAAVLDVLMQPGSFMLDESSVSRLSDMFGERVKPNNLQGLVFNLKQELADTRKKLAQLEAGSGKVVTAVSSNNNGVSIDAGLYSRICEKAAFQEISASQFVENSMSMALDNGWL